MTPRQIDRLLSSRQEVVIVDKYGDQAAVRIVSRDRYGFKFTMDGISALGIMARDSVVEFHPL